MSRYFNKILALPSGGYFHILKKIYIYCKHQLGCRISVLTQTEYIKPYADFIDSNEQLILLPSMLRRQPWEENLDEIERIKQLILAAEMNVRIPINRILLANERTIGRAYSKFHYYWPERKLARLSLKDSDIGYQIIMRMFKFAFDLLNEYQPSLCLGAPTGGLVNTVFYMLTQYLNIPYVACNKSVVATKRHFWALNWGTFNTAVAIKYREKIAEKSPYIQSTINSIKEFRKNPTPLAHYQVKWRNSSKQANLRCINKDILGRILYRLVPIVRRKKLVNPKPLLQFSIDLYRSYVLRRLQKKYYHIFSDEELSSFKYIYYPFHVDPEIVLNVMAPFWHNQLNTIKILSYNLPFGYKLLVREHRYNVGRRCTKYLKQLSQLPGVVLIDAYDNQYKYMKHADLVVTVNGTSGFEGIMLQKPVLTLDKTFYDGLNIAKTISNYLDFGLAILNIIHSFKVTSDYDEKIALFLDSENEVTLPDEASPEVELSYIKKVINESNPPSVSFFREELEQQEEALIS